MPSEKSSSGAVFKWLTVSVALLLAVGALFLGRARWKRPDGANPPTAAAPIEVARTNLILTEGRLHLTGQTNSFTGFMIEHHASGALRSRSVISNGLLHGISEGWYTNGQRQVTEHFKEGVSHGVRTKWSASGAKTSEASIVDGKLHGTFRRWHENGTLSEQVEFFEDQPQGTSLAYFPSGYLKARVVLRDGRPEQQTFWKDGELKE